VTVLLSTLSSLLVGLVLVVAPWTALWDTNYLLQPYPLIRSWLLSEFTRGAVTGLGLVNILLAASEVYHLLADSGEPG
jgi:hypothetical protein